MTGTHRFDPSPWGELIRARREQQGRSIRQAALLAGLSDAYWGQLEKGYRTSKSDGQVAVHPSRRALLAVADSLRMTARETSQLLAVAGHKAYVPGEHVAQRESEVDLTGLSRRDVALLNALADRFRASVVEGDGASTETPLRAVASGQRGPAGQREARAKARRAREQQGDDV